MSIAQSHSAVRARKGIHKGRIALIALATLVLIALKTPQWIDGRTKEPIVSHGFRSTFRDWCAEQTNFPREIAEACLAHIVGNKVETAYLRTDHFEKRRRLMDEWAKYCQTRLKKGGNNVRQLRA
jgi:integrase